LALAMLLFTNVIAAPCIAVSWAVSVVLPNEHPVHRISVTNPWAGCDFETARIAIEDALGNPISDSGPVTADLGEYCADEAFGMSRKVPDPRAALALAPACPP
jgi:hypothetical protein